MKKQLNTESMKQKYIEFVNGSKTFSISTLDHLGNPFISYAPFIKHEGKLYIFISGITEHFKYIEENELIHIMMIADDSKSPNLFARERVRFQCTTKKIDNDNNEEIFSKFEEIHGTAMIKLLRGLGDMALFELTPIDGRYVVGFGAAFDVDLSGNKFEHVVVEKEK